MNTNVISHSNSSRGYDIGQSNWNFREIPCFSSYNTYNEGMNKYENREVNAHECTLIQHIN